MYLLFLSGNTPQEESVKNEPLVELRIPAYMLESRRRVLGAIEPPTHIFDRMIAIAARYREVLAALTLLGAMASVLVFK